MKVEELLMKILLIKTVQSISAKMYIYIYIYIYKYMYYSLRYYKEETQLVRLFFTKGVVELVVKILQRVSENSFLKLKL